MGEGGARGVDVKVGNGLSNCCAVPVDGESGWRFRIVRNTAPMIRPARIPSRILATDFMVPPWWCLIDGSHHSEP